MLDTQPRPTIRTLVASFLFTDLVGFSKGTAADQYAAKARLSAVLRRHLAPLREEDYWIKDTGDGALIAFVSNPEHALYMALALGQDYGAGAVGTTSGSLRTGLHLGTVKESIDVEARRNFIGDGINAAKRIMDFALPGQSTASRAFFEAIGNLDAAYAELFQHVGAADDKHGRAHDLYTVSPSASVLDRLREDLAAASGSLEPSVKTPPPTAAASTTAARSARFNRPLIIAGVMVAFAAVAITLRWREPAGPPTPAARSQSAVEAPLPATKAPDVGPASSTETPAPQRASPPANSASPPAIQNDAPRRAAEPPPRAATAPSSRPAPETRPRAPAQASASEAKSGATTSPRCTRIVEKAAVGEPLTAEEKRELGSCR